MILRLLTVAVAVTALAVAMGALLSGDSSAAQSPAVRIGSLSLSVGGQGATDLDALKMPSPGLSAWTVDVIYDPAIVSVVDCTGGLFGLCNPTFAPDTARTAGFSLFGATGDLTLATFTVSCVANGTSPLSITLQTFMDSTQPISATLDEGSVSCSGGPSTETPTPTATLTVTPTGSPTATSTVDPNATATPTAAPAIDSDNDGCTDVQELGSNPLLGGQRDPQDFWDFFDPNRDRSVSLTDFFALLPRFGTNDAGGTATINRTTDPLSTPPETGYHPRFDRGFVTGANPWNVAPADGAIAVTDFFALVAQFGHTCA